MINFLLSVFFLIVGLLLGFYLLLLGRRRMVLTTALISLAATGSLLALISLGEGSAWALTAEPNWPLLGITVAAGIIGGILGSRQQRVAAAVVGFFAGGYIALWFYKIAFYLVVNIAHWPKQTAFWVGVAILIIGGLIGLYLTRRSEAVTLIMITVFVGADIIVRALGLSSESSFTAVIAISLALLGLVVQYAQYLREIKADRPQVIAEGETPVTEYFDL